MLIDAVGDVPQLTDDRYTGSNVISRKHALVAAQFSTADTLTFDRLSLDTVPTLLAARSIQ